MIKVAILLSAITAWSTAMAAEVPPLVAPTPVAAIAAAPPIAAVPVKIVAATSPVVEPIICHSSVETGSLVRRKKVCLTRKQWSYVNDTNHDQAQRYVDDSRSRPSSN